MRFLVDAQLPSALARWLTSKGHLAEHTKDVGFTKVSDGVLWQYAMTHQATIITKDSDFAQRRLRARSGPIIVWIKLSNSTRRELLAWFENLMPDILGAIERGETLLEIY